MPILLCNSTTCSLLLKDMDSLLLLGCCFVMLSICIRDGCVIFGGLGAEAVKNMAMLKSEEVLVNSNLQMTKLSSFFNGHNYKVTFSVAKNN